MCCYVNSGRKRRDHFPSRVVEMLAPLDFCGGWRPSACADTPRGCNSNENLATSGFVHRVASNKEPASISARHRLFLKCAAIIQQLLAERRAKCGRDGLVARL